MCISTARAIHGLCTRLGIQFNLPKSDLVPSQKKQYLGMVLDSVQARVFPSPERVTRFQSLAHTFLEDRAPTVVLWRSLLGHLASLERIVPGGRVHSRSLQWCLKSHWKAASDPTAWRVPPSQRCLEDLFWWMDPAHLCRGAPFVMAPPEQTLFSDASHYGWGAHLGDSLASGVWSPEERRFHINHLEMMAVFLALQSFQQELSGSVVSLMSDNSTVVAYLRNSGGTRSESLSDLAGEVL